MTRIVKRIKGENGISKEGNEIKLGGELTANVDMPVNDQSVQWNIGATSSPLGQHNLHVIQGYIRTDVSPGVNPVAELSYNPGEIKMGVTFGSNEGSFKADAGGGCRITSTVSADVIFQTNQFLIRKSTSPLTTYFSVNTDTDNTVVRGQGYLNLLSTGTGLFRGFGSFQINPTTGGDNPVMDLSYNPTDYIRFIIPHDDNTDYDQVTLDDVHFEKGFMYAADYSANNSANARWLTDKAYVDSAISSGVTASNGLTKVGADVRLGGLITAPTSLVRNYSIFGTDYTQGMTFQNGNFSFSTSNITNGNAFGFIMGNPNASEELFLGYFDESGNQKGVTISDSLFTITDQDKEVGMSYAADYSANNASNPRWIVDKEYVDSAVEASEVIAAWANYADTQYTQGSPFIPAAATPVTLPNNAGNTVDTYMPSGLKFYDEVTQKITPSSVGETYSLRVNFTCLSPTNNNNLIIRLDIGGTQGVILSRTIPLRLGNNVTYNISTSNEIFALGTFIANGGEITIEAQDANTEIYDISYYIVRNNGANFDIPDAPADGNTYGRNNGAWVQADSGIAGSIDFQSNTRAAQTSTIDVPPLDFGDGSNFIARHIGADAITITKAEILVDRVTGFGSGDLVLAICSLPQDQASLITYGSAFPSGDPTELGTATTLTEVTVSASDSRNANENCIGYTQNLNISVPANVGLLVGCQNPWAVNTLRVKLFYKLT